jgi:hypothetical protein
MIDQKPSWRHASASGYDSVALWTVDLAFEDLLVYQSSSWFSSLSSEVPVRLWDFPISGKRSNTDLEVIEERHSQ